MRSQHHSAASGSLVSLGGAAHPRDDEAPQDNPHDTRRCLEQGIENPRMAARVEQLQEFESAGHRANEQHRLRHAGREPERQGHSQQDVGQSAFDVGVAQMWPQFDGRQRCKGDEGQQGERGETGDDPA